MSSIATGTRQGISRRWLACGVGGLAVVLLIGLVVPAGGGTPLQSALGARGNVETVLALALPAYLAGVFSLLSPCCLPILPAYFSFTFGAQRQRVVSMSIAFFLGLATTLVVLGASFSALGSLVSEYRDTVTLVGGLLVAAFGVMLVLGKGFSGIRVRERPAATVAGTYLYGMTFALGWTPCVGPILGALLTALATTGISVLAGASLAFLYALGLATPLTLLATFFGRMGRDSRLAHLLRGRGWEVNLGARTLYLHSTSLISGLMIIAVGLLLATGKLTLLTQSMATGTAGQMAVALEAWLANLFRLGQ